MNGIPRLGGKSSNRILSTCSDFAMYLISFPKYVGVEEVRRDRMGMFDISRCQILLNHITIVLESSTNMNDSIIF